MVGFVFPTGAAGAKGPKSNNPHRLAPEGGLFQWFSVLLKKSLPDAERRYAYYEYKREQRSLYGYAGKVYSHTFGGMAGAMAIGKDHRIRYAILPEGNRCQFKPGKTGEFPARGARAGVSFPWRGTDQKQKMGGKNEQRP